MQPQPHFTGPVSAGEPIRALVADDSAFMRKMVSDILRRAGMEVVATAFDGQDALEKARALRPDVITLDVEMPRMDGVDFLRALLPEQPTPVVVLSSLTEAGADTTIRCLELGAFDCLHKPSGAISLDIERIGEDIVARVRAAARTDARLLRQASSPAARAVSPLRPHPGHSGALRASGQDALVLIASSTGGPAALQQVVPRLPADLAAPVVIVQHLPVGFTKSLASRLNAASALTVREAEDGCALERGVVLVAPGGQHLAFDAAGRISLNDEPSLWGVRPAADIMLRTAAERFGSRVVAAILTGMGRDGALGAKAIRRAGGTCLAQDEATCVVFGMPRAAYEAGGVERLVPIGEMAGAIEEAVAVRQRAVPSAVRMP